MRVVGLDDAQAVHRVVNLRRMIIVDRSAMHSCAVAKPHEWNIGAARYAGR